MDYFDMDLGLSDEDRALKEAAHKFAREVMRPAARELDRITRDRASRESVTAAGLYPIGEGAGFAGGIGFWVVTMLSGQPAILALLAGALAVAAGYAALAVIPAFLRDYKTMFGLVARALPKKAG